mgnify:FL=1
MNKLKACQIIKNSYCGHFLDVPVSELVRKVIVIECENILLGNQIKNVLVEISILKRLTNG